MYRLSRIFILCFILLFFTSCYKEQPVSPREYCDLLLKVKDFLAFCCFVLNSPKPFYGQIISRIYYSYFTLARLIVINKTEYDNSYNHESVWQKTGNSNLKEIYGKELKWKRCKYDYDAIHENNIKEQLQDISFLVKNKHLFDYEIETIENTLEDNPNLTSESDETCRKLLQEIRISHQDIITKLEHIIKQS